MTGTELYITAGVAILVGFAVYAFLKRKLRPKPPLEAPPMSEPLPPIPTPKEPGRGDP